MIDLTVTKDFIYDLKADFTMNDKKDLYQFINGDLVKPGLIRDDKNGHKIELEIFNIPLKNIGKFVENIKYPLGIGNIELDDGTFKYGSIVTADIFQNKRDGLEKLQKEEFSDFDILAVDMESAAIMHISTIFNTASVAIRAVSDVIGMPSQITNFYQYTKKASEEISSILEKFVSRL